MGSAPISEPAQRIPAVGEPVVGVHPYPVRMTFSVAPRGVENLPAALRTPPAVGAPAHVAPVVYSVAEAYVNPSAWPRVILDEEAVVGFVMANCDIAMRSRSSAPEFGV